MAEALVKTGMCKINESPCQLQFRSKMFHFLCPTREVEWLSLTAWTGFHLFISSLSKNHFTVTASRRSKAEHLRKSHSEDLCIRVKWSVEFVCRDALVSSIQEPLFYSEELFRIKNSHSIRFLYRQNGTSRSFCMSAAGISSPNLISFHNTKLPNLLITS